MATTVWHAPASASNVDVGSGFDWLNPTNVLASDDTRASSALSGGGTPATNVLRVVDFGFDETDIPIGSVIDGIEVGIERRAVSNNAVDLLVQLRTADNLVGINQADTVTVWPTTDTEVIYGGAADTWDAFLTAAQVRSAGFGVDLRVERSLGNPTPEVDHIRVRITHHIPEPPPTLPPEPDIGPEDGTGKALAFAEIDLPICALVYGEAPCQAELGVTGTIKCFNTLSTCQDLDNFEVSSVTVRFAKDVSYLPESGIEAIPSVEDVEFVPATLSLGEDLGERGSARITFVDHPWSDTGPGFDKYAAERTYDPFTQGTLFSKLRARHLSLRGANLRVIQGYLGQDIEDMEARHFIIESWDGPKPDGRFTVVGKDPLKSADGDRAQAPRMSNGFLAADITDVATSATLSPAGIGDAEYPASGYVAIAGKEIAAFTRSADVLTLTRAQFETEAAGHSADGRVQLVLFYDAQSAANLCHDLLTVYAGMPEAFIPLAIWQLETTTYNPSLYSAVIAEPTPVRDLLSELCEQAALVIWWSDTLQVVRLRVLRGVPASVQRFDEETNIIESSLDIIDQPESRRSQVWHYYAKRNPLAGHTDPDNYRSVEVTVDDESEATFGGASIHKIFSRWIPVGGRAVASKVNDLILSRYRTPPRRFTFEAFRGPAAPVLGEAYRIASWAMQDETGLPVDAPIQITRVRPGPAVIGVEAEEMLAQLFDESALATREITFDSPLLNVNVRDVHDTLFPALREGDVIIVTIEAGVVIGSANTGAPAMDIGTWPVGTGITLVIHGRVQGCGGRGAGGANVPNKPGNPGRPGGPALFTRHDIDIQIDEADGEIWGGGGGGGSRSSSTNNGGDGGGGGAGSLGGAGGTGGKGSETGADGEPGEPGTAEAGGESATAFEGSDGGGPGLPGEDATSTNPGTGGDPGSAIDGVSFTTFVDGAGDVRGPTIN